MAYSNACTRCAQLAFASITATAVSMSVVAAPPVRSQLPIEHYLVHLQATTVSAVENSATFAAEALVGDDLPGVQTASPAAATSELAELTKSSTADAIAAERAIPAAAATAEDNFWDSPLGTALIAVNVLLLPIWFLAAPITLPLSMLAAVSQIPEDDPIGTLKFLVLTAVGFLTGPIGVFDIFTRQNPTPAAAVKSSATRSLGQAEDLPQETADETPLAADSGSDIDETATGGNLTSNRTAAPLGDPRPKRATAIKPAASINGGGGVESSNAAAEVDDAALPRSSAERASRSSVQAQSRQARVDSSTD